MPCAADILKEYEGILKKTTAFFKGPSAESRRVLETESSLSIGTKKLPIGQALRKPVLEVSALLVGVLPCSHQVTTSGFMRCKISHGAYMTFIF